MASSSFSDIIDLLIETGMDDDYNFAEVDAGGGDCIAFDD